MSNFANDIEDVVDEPILSVVIGEGTEYSIPNYELIPKFIVLDWSEGRKWLDFETEYGFGSPSQPAIYAYTKHYVIGLYQYDGSTGFFVIPRNPIPCEPDMPGG